MTQTDHEPITDTAGGTRYRTFRTASCHGLYDASLELVDLQTMVNHVTDPNSATETIHWGRNYLFATVLATDTGPVEVVVKQFRNQSLLQRLRRRRHGSKATRSWHAAQYLLLHGIPTPEPLLLIESNTDDGPSFYVTRRLARAHEVRHFFRRLNNEPEPGKFPDVDSVSFLCQLGRLVRKLHDVGVRYRDLSIGNVLARSEEDGELRLYLVDCNRARINQQLSVLARCRDMNRFPLQSYRHCAVFYQAYWDAQPAWYRPSWWVLRLSILGYLLKHRIKNRLRGKHKHRQRLNPGGRHHAHIPPAEAAASRRDRIVWDRLSDQPHQHATTLDKLAIRLADGREYLRDYALVVSCLPRVWRRYRQLRQQLYEHPVPFCGAGVCLRPLPEFQEQQLQALTELKLTSVLLRLHPWETDHSAEQLLATRLVDAGYEVSFVIPQNRELVRDRNRWRAAVTELGEQFAPFGRHFQVGQAVNRSKWGIWSSKEYIDLFLEASQILRENHDVSVLGPAVIDFEYQTTMALVNRSRDGLRFDTVSALLYVDRRGAPESTQLGFDTIDKVTLLRAIAETGTSCGNSCWITEVNWPLWEGPHSPAGRTVSVDEQTQADYLVRYFLLSLGTGLVERVFWWRLIARGYGLTTIEPDGQLRRRPSFTAFATMSRELADSDFLGPLQSPDGAYLYHYRRAGDDLVVAWSRQRGMNARLPVPARSVIDRDGAMLTTPSGTDIELTCSPRYYRLREPVADDCSTPV